MHQDKKRTKGSSLMRGLGAALLLTLPALVFGQDAAAEVAPVANKGDTAWMMTATLLVIMMAVPGLALFYGGMVRSKNVLSTFMQVFVIFSIGTVLWVIYGYSFAFNGPGMWFGDMSRFMLHGLTADSNAATFTKGVVIPEYVFVVFQATFAAITTALAIGGFAERTKFSAVLIWAVIWFTFSYLPIARMVWYSEGYLFKLGALDYAGGTVVHINAGIAGLVGALIVGKRTGFGTAAMPPHNMPVRHDRRLPAVGRLVRLQRGFGSRSQQLRRPGVPEHLCLHSDGGGGLDRSVNGSSAASRQCSAQLRAPSPAWSPSLRPAAWSVLSGAIILGLVVGLICLWACASLKKMLGYDDSLDVFGVHCVGGIVGALSCAILGHPSLGGVGAFESIGTQLGIQATGVAITLVWSGVVSAIAFYLIKFTIGLRPSEDVEREGLDTTEHGERAYEF